MRTGRGASTHGDVASAVTLLDRAVGLLPRDDARRPDALTDLQYALVYSGDIDHIIGILHVRGAGIEPRLEQEQGMAEGTVAIAPLIETAAGIMAALDIVRASPRVVSRRDLEREVWGEMPPDSDALRSHLYNLRKVIDRPFDRPLLHTVAAAGYRLADDAGS